MNTYEIEYWYLSYPEESYDYSIIKIDASNRDEAISKAQKEAPTYAKKFTILNVY